MIINEIDDRLNTFEITDFNLIGKEYMWKILTIEKPEIYNRIIKYIVLIYTSLSKTINEG